MLRAAYRIGTKLPGPVKSAAKWAVYCSRFYGVEREILNLNTIPKSGTHKAKLFLANYIGLERGVARPVDYPTMMRDYFPNLRDEYIGGIAPYAPPPLTGQPFGDFVHSHSTRFLEYFPGRLMFLYRHPLDQIVSRLHHTYLSRGLAVPEGAVEEFAHVYGAHRNVLAALGEKRPIFVFTYEDMMRDAGTVFIEMLRWIGYRPSPDLVAQAVRNSDFDTVRAFETANGRIHAGPEQTGFHARDGRTGQWKTALGAGDVDAARRILDAYGVDAG